MKNPNHSNPTEVKENRFKNRPWLAVILVSVILILLLEGISQLALMIRNSLVNTEQSKDEYTENLRTQDSIESPILSEELSILYQDSIDFHPYRWYKLPKNFNGKYFQTDPLGYRFKPNEEIGSRPILACYGGSTMFSIYTRQESTLPSILNNLGLLKDSLYALNFGIAAYGSSTELVSFIESTRKYPVREALFFDGVNEVIRYLDRFMFARGEPIYDYWHYPYAPPLPYAYMNALHSRPAEFEMRKKREWKPALYWVSVSLIGKIKKLFTTKTEVIQTTEEGWTSKDYDEAGKIAAQIYLNNIRDIKAMADAKGIKTYFVLQPTLYTTKRQLTEKEKSILSQDHPFVGAIHESTYKYIREADKSDLNFIDLSEGWDDLPAGDYFYDWCHVNHAGNEHLAYKISQKMNQYR